MYIRWSCFAIPGEAAPQHRSNKPSAPPSWARGNPYAKAFPRARTWTRNRVAGLSGEKPPSGWHVEAQKEEAALAERAKQISAKDLYVQLVNATLERKSTTLPAKPLPPTAPLEKGAPQYGTQYGTNVSLGTH